MAAERPVGRKMLNPELRQQGKELGHLVGQDLGLYGIGRGRDGWVMLVEEGMPDEFKDVLTTAVPGEQITIREIAEPTPPFGQSSGESALDRMAREVEAEADADPTGEARRELDYFREEYKSEKDRLLERRRQQETPQE